MGIFDFFGILKGMGALAPYVSSGTEKKIISDWDKVKMLRSTKGPSQLRQALIIADKSLDNALKDVSTGETMGERLKNARQLFDRDVYGKIWEAHKVRNNMVHELDYDPPYHVILESINSFNKGLSELRIKIN